VLNLSVFETFFQERRHSSFRRGIFRFDVNCSAVNDCNTARSVLFTAHRPVAPAGGLRCADAAVASTIYGAAKLTAAFQAVRLSACWTPSRA